MLLGFKAGTIWPRDQQTLLVALFVFACLLWKMIEGC